MHSQIYDQKFYDDITRQSVESARVFLQHLFSIWRPRSVVDIGCGQGAWLSIAGELLVDRLVGVDGGGLTLVSCCRRRSSSTLPI
jgi:hypothetical protein